MTPEEHIAKAEDYLNAATSSYKTMESKILCANMALAHIEMAKWKEKHNDYESA